MKRIIIILIVVAVGGYFTYNYYQDYYKEKAKDKAAKEEHQKKNEMIRAALTEMTSKYNAVNVWEDRLTEQGKKRIGSILTVELEKLWIINQPIVFKGKISDISALDASNYSMQLRGRRNFRTELALTLKSPKRMIDSFLSAHPNATSYFSSVAVIAKVNKIVTSEAGIKTGVGDCLDILFYGDLWFTDELKNKK